MESALVSPTRLIEYPNDLSECGSLELGRKKLLYLCSHREDGTPYIVVLGFYAGQKEDFVTKDLIEPVGEIRRRLIEQALARSLPPEYSGAHFLFL